MLILSGIAYLRLLAAFVFKHLRFRSYRVVAGLAVAALAVLCSLSLDFIQPLFVLYWLIPAATWCYFCFFVRSYAEHPVVDGDANCSTMVFTREVRPTWFDRLFLATSGFIITSRITLHHSFPSITCLASTNERSVSLRSGIKWCCITDITTSLFDCFEIVRLLSCN